MKKSKNNMFLSVSKAMGLRYFQDHVGRSAAELAYYMLFSVFPLLIFLNSVVSLLDISGDELLTLWNRVLPEPVLKIIVDYVDYASGLQSRTLLYAGLFLTVYMLTRAVSSLMGSLMAAYRIDSRGVIYTVLAFVFSVVALAGLFVVLVLYMISGELLERLSEYIALSPGFIFIWRLLRMALAPVLVFFLLTLLYYFVGRGYHSFAGAMPGAAFSLAAWLIATMGFSYYLSNFSRYTVLYGSIGAMMILMLWLYWTGLVLIMGGELNYAIATEKNKRKDFSI